MTKRDRQLREYVAEGRVYGAGGELLRLTDDERTAIMWAADVLDDGWPGSRPKQLIAAMRALLERTK